MKSQCLTGINETNFLRGAKNEIIRKLITKKHFVEDQVKCRINLYNKPFYGDWNLKDLDLNSIGRAANALYQQVNNKNTIPQKSQV